MPQERPIVGVLVALLLVGFVANVYHVRQQYHVHDRGWSGPRGMGGDVESEFAEMVSNEGEDETSGGRAVLVADGDGGATTAFVQRATPKPRKPTDPVKLPAWLDGIKVPHEDAVTTNMAIVPSVSPMLRVDPTTKPATVNNNGAGGDSRWPRWQDLPDACNPKSVRPTVKIPFEEFASNTDGDGKRSDDYKIHEINKIEELPSKYYTREPFKPEEFTLIPHHVPGGKDNERTQQLFDKFLKEAPDSHVLYCFPWGIGVDNTIAGPMSKPKEETSPLQKFMLFLGKFWYARPGDVNAIKENKAQIIDVPGMVVQLSGWTAFVFNHFALDSMVRLSMVIDRLKSDDPLWGTAKLMAAITPVQDKKVDGTWRVPQPEEMKSGAFWVWKRLGLDTRIIPATGWAYKAIAAYRAEYLVLPDVYPHPSCADTNGVKDPWFPRGALMPLQRALGVFDKGIKRNLVVWAGREGGMRHLERTNEAALQEEVKKAIASHNRRCPQHDLEFHVFQHENPEPNGGTWHDFEVFRRAVMVFGPHGQQLWNHAFAAPGTTVIEFTALSGLDPHPSQGKKEDCRHCGWALANACGHNYWIEEPDGFGFFRGGMKPDITRVMSIVHSALTNMSITDGCNSA